MTVALLAPEVSILPVGPIPVLILGLSKFPPHSLESL